MPVRDLHEHDLGLTWVMDEAMARASHAIAHEGRVWIVDPVDAGDAIERAAALGEPAAVIQLLDRHNRDAEAVADRLGVPHLRQPESIPDCPLYSVPIMSNRLWQEVALWLPEKRGLVVAEAVGTNPMAHPGSQGAGVHVMLRLTPPRGALGAFEPRHLLVGHGPPIHGEQAERALREALARSRRDLPAALAAMPRAMRA